MLEIRSITATSTNVIQPMSVSAPKFASVHKVFSAGELVILLKTTCRTTACFEYPNQTDFLPSTASNPFKAG